MFQKIFNSGLLLLCVCLVSCASDSSNTNITVESQLQLNVAESLYKDDIALLNATYQIPYNCPLDLGASSIKSGMKFASYFNLNVNKMIPTLGDLKPKYILLKNKDEQLVYGIKAGDTLAFKLIDFPK